VAHAVRTTGVGATVGSVVRDVTSSRPARAVRRIARPVLAPVRRTVRPVLGTPPAATPVTPPEQTPAPSHAAPAPASPARGTAGPAGTRTAPGATAPGTSGDSGASIAAQRAGASPAAAPADASAAGSLAHGTPGTPAESLGGAPAPSVRVPALAAPGRLAGLAGTSGAAWPGDGANSLLTAPGAVTSGADAGAPAAASRTPQAQALPRGGRIAPGAPWSATGAGAGAGSAGAGLPLVPVLAILSFSLIAPAGAMRIRLAPPGTVPAAPLAPLERPG
jgi:hypothetical protein